ncbi:MAG TPA: glycosyltransferase family 87 protein, partial [Gemmatales bacterium]|nr:glycosyltransferase family 87 protein [Gemmatales bacterium]
LLPFLPMGWVDFLTAIQLQMGLNLFLLSVSCWLWGTVFLPKYPLVSLGVIAFWVPTWTLLGLGQVTPWILFGFTGWYFALRNGKPILAGALLNCVIIKPHLGLGLVAYAMVLGICRRQWSMLASFLVTLAVLVTLTFLIRSSVWNEYFASLEVSNPRKWANATLDG